MLIFRYICREVMTVVAAILLVMLVVMLMAQTANYLSKIAHGSIAMGFFGRLILLNIPFLVSYILPFAFYFGLLLAYGRLFAESEMVVMQASGFSNRRLFVYSFIQALVIAAITAYLILVLNPTLITQKGKILLNSHNNVLQTIVPGRFKSLEDGNVIIYVSKTSSDKKDLKNIFFAKLDKSGKDASKDRWTVSYAASAHQVKNKNGHDYLQTSKGVQYKGVPGQKDYDILKYSHYAYLLKGSIVSGGYNRLDGMSTSQLFSQRKNIKSISELEWRISLVLQILVLTLFAVPLSRVQPRQGRYAKFLPAIVFYLIYINLLFIARYLLEDGVIKPVFGLWWAHIVMLGFVLFYYAKVYHWRFRR